MCIRLLTEFNYVFETPYNNRNESSFSCTIDRPPKPDNPSEMMYVMNHFLYGTLQLGQMTVEIPQKGTANVTNSDGSLLKQAQACTQAFGRQPNFLEVDFYNLGDTLKIAAQLNNVTYSGTTSQCDGYAAKYSTSSSTDSSEAIQTISFSSVSLLLSLIAATFFIFF
jgi:hypothetical protein